MIPTPVLGARFDIDRLGGGAYGLAAWKMFWKAVSRRGMAGALLYEGDSSATLSGTERVFMIAVHHQDVTVLQRVAAALNASVEYQAVAASPDLSWNESVAAEPLPDAGRLDGRGALIGGFWAKSALDAVKVGEPKASPPRVETPTAAGAQFCPNCGAATTAGDEFCGECGTILVAEPAAPIPDAGAPAGDAVAPQALFCPNCGAATPAGDEFCGECGTTLIAPPTPGAGALAGDAVTPQALFCPNCGTAATAGDEFCSECGTNLRAEPAAPSILPVARSTTPLAGFPLWAWIAVGVVLLLIMGSGIFVLMRGERDGGGGIVAERRASGPFLPAAGGYTGQDSTTFQVMMVVFEDSSPLLDFALIACMPEGSIQNVPFTIETDIPITSDGSFQVRTNTLDIKGKFTSETRAEGTILPLDFDAWNSCGIPPAESQWASVCTLSAVRTDEGGFSLGEGARGPCVNTSAPVPEDFVEPPSGPIRGEITTGAGDLLIADFKLTNEYPAGCTAFNSSDLCTESGDGDLLAVVTLKAAAGGPLDISTFVGELFGSYLVSSNGRQAQVLGILPSMDSVYLAIVYGMLDTGDSGPQNLNWQGNPEIPLRP